MKAVNFFSRIFCYGANMDSRLKFDEYVKKYSSLTPEEIEKLIQSEIGQNHVNIACHGFTFDYHSFQNRPFVESDGIKGNTDKNIVSVHGPQNELKNGQEIYYLLVEWRANGLERSKQKMIKKIVYKAIKITD